ncbi:MAG: hypothetical protein ABIY62_05360 [Ginsengibacter sp.]
MPYKIIKRLAVTCLLLFSLQGFSQTPDKSEHPLLDKYYPQQQKFIDTNKTMAKQIKPISQTNTLPATATVTTPKAPVVNPAATVAPVVKPAPAEVITAPVVNTPVETTTPSVTNLPAVTTTSVITNAPVVNRPVVVIPPDPVQKKVQPQHKDPPYIDTRLGSSSPLYDTYEKNANGTGSVTTSPK